MQAVSTERLWLTEPRRTTALAEVVAVRGRMFALDRSLFAPTSRTHRHPQPADKGTVWISGEKRRLERVQVRDGNLWHELRGTTPPVGAKVQIHLDADRRLLTARAHTALHLLLASLHADSAPPMVADPEVKGGGTFRIEVAEEIAPVRLAAALAKANQDAAKNRPLSSEHITRTYAAKILDAQRFRPADPFPGGDVLSVVRIDGVCAYPCDGTLLPRTGPVGRIQIAHVHRVRDRFVISAKVTG